MHCAVYMVSFQPSPKWFSSKTLKRNFMFLCLFKGIKEDQIHNFWQHCPFPLPLATSLWTCETSLWTWGSYCPRSPLVDFLEILFAKTFSLPTHSFLFFFFKCRMTEFVEVKLFLPSCFSESQSPSLPQASLSGAEARKLGHGLQNSLWQAGGRGTPVSLLMSTVLSQLYLGKWDLMLEVIRTVIMTLFCKMSHYGVFLCIIF